MGARLQPRGGDVVAWNKRGFLCVPAYEAFRDAPGGPAKLFVDGLHFNEAGAELQARLTSEYLRAHWAELAASASPPAAP